MSFRSCAKPLTFFLIIVFTIHQKGCAQISPPGLDGTHVVMWSAVGINQTIGKKWFNQSYVGGSRFSDPNNNAIMKKQAIYVVEQQTYRQFGSHWQLGFCFSVRGQNMYADDPPYENALPAIRRELRYYLRLYYRHKIDKFSFAYSLRPEWRNFYSPDWSNFYASPKALRYRAKAQVGMAVGQTKRSSIILTNEFLFVEVEERTTTGKLSWSPFSLSEDRVCTYYRHTFTKPSVILDFGIMQQMNFSKGKFTSDFVHFAFDVLLINPFGRKLKSV